MSIGEKGGVGSWRWRGGLTAALITPGGGYPDHKSHEVLVFRSPSSYLLWIFEVVQCTLCIEVG